jgi:hypothetical protein
MKDYISGIISILASFQLLFVSVFLFAHRKGNRTNNRLLGMVFLLFSISLGDFALRISGIEFWWTDLGGQFHRKTIHQTGIDSHFIIWSLVLVLSMILFIAALRKIGSPKQAKE